MNYTHKKLKCLFFGLEKPTMEKIKTFIAHLLSMKTSEEYTYFHNRMTHLLESYGSLSCAKEEKTEEEKDLFAFFDAISYRHSKTKDELRAALFYKDMGFRHDDGLTMRIVLRILALYFSDMVHPTDEDLNEWIGPMVIKLFGNRRHSAFWKELMKIGDTTAVYTPPANWTPADHRSRSAHAIEELKRVETPTFGRGTHIPIIYDRHEDEQPQESRFLTENMTRILEFYSETCKADNPNDHRIIAWNAFMFPFLQSEIEKSNLELHYWMGIQDKDQKRRVIRTSAKILCEKDLTTDAQLDAWVRQYGDGVFIDFEYSLWGSSFILG
jgi:hypothetical protein